MCREQGARYRDRAGVYDLKIARTFIDAELAFTVQRYLSWYCWSTLPSINLTSHQVNLPPPVEPKARPFSPSRHHRIANP